MNIITKENYSIIVGEDENIEILFQAISDAYKEVEAGNIIIDLQKNEQITIDNLLLFQELANKHRAAKHSFVIINNSLLLEDIPEELIVVPTLLEAEDIIQMEDIERDLDVF
ncbi:hypothetical protein GGR32_001858 [Mesonia hippocampi]|uniref:Uncharacterized protein n=1 Tax=Mesonia hippocampi TaxID=1628250 RepID=A0A840EVL4_9FLAO|nr:ribonuclease Z [Mesonia hippocampi]MBB4119556.1 hypothetical protein [Mesonia hippocampi]